jgi:hypothetical protein
MENQQTTWSSQSWLPLQAVPVDRTPGTAALSDGSGVEASGLLDFIPGFSAVKPTLGDLGSAVWSFL